MLSSVRLSGATGYRILLTCSCDDGDKVLHSLAMTELLLSQSSTVAVIVDPDGQVQGVRDGRSQVHGGPLLDQLGGVKDEALLWVYAPTRGHSCSVERV